MQLFETVCALSFELKFIILGVFAKLLTYCTKLNDILII